MSRWKILHPTAALAELMARDAEAEGRPFSGWQGERAAPAEPLPPAPPPLVIPPPCCSTGSP